MPQLLKLRQGSRWHQPHDGKVPLVLKHQATVIVEIKDGVGELWQWHSGRKVQKPSGHSQMNKQGMGIIQVQ
jgi:hypothetical protein